MTLRIFCRRLRENLVSLGLLHYVPHARVKFSIKNDVHTVDAERLCSICSIEGCAKRSAIMSTDGVTLTQAFDFRVGDLGNVRMGKVEAGFSVSFLQFCQ